MPGPAVGEVVTVHGCDDNMLKAKRHDRWRNVFWLARVEGPRQPGLHSAKPAARVQVSPMIIMVACFFSQHSPIFGQPASSAHRMQPVRADNLRRIRIAS